MFHGLIGLKFREESDRDLFWTRVDSCWLVPDWCWLVLDSRWFALTCVGLVLDSYWFMLTRVELVLTHVNSCWLVLPLLTYVGTRVLEQTWSKIVLLKDRQNFWWKETLLKVDLENKMVPQLWVLWWFSKLWTTEEANYR